MKSLITAFALIACGPAMSAGSLDLRFASGSYEIDDDDAMVKVESEDPSGADLRAYFEASKNVFVRAEYLTSKTDEIEVNGADAEADLDFQYARGGIGLQGGSSFLYYGAIEYADVDFDVGNAQAKGDGLMVSGGLKDVGTGKFLWNAELSLGVAGVDVTLGYRFTPNFALFGGAQGCYFEDNNDVEYDVFHATVGARLSF